MFLKMSMSSLLPVSQCVCVCVCVVVVVVVVVALIVVQLLSRVSDSLQPHGLQQTRLPCSLSPRVCSLRSIVLVMPSSHLILCWPLLLLLSTFPSIRVFSSESAPHIRWPKYRSFSFSISSSKEYSLCVCKTVHLYISIQIELYIVCIL